MLAVARATNGEREEVVCSIKSGEEDVSEVDVLAIEEDEGPLIAELDDDYND